MVVLREEVSAGLSTSISQLEEEMAVLIGNIEVPPELLTDQLEPITESLKAVFEQLKVKQHLYLLTSLLQLKRT